MAPHDENPPRHYFYGYREDAVFGWKWLSHLNGSGKSVKRISEAKFDDGPMVLSILNVL
jgi:hypothetical protein